MLIDFHTHAFPDALAPRALSKLAGPIRVPPVTDGTLDGLDAVMKASGVGRAVICNIATNARQTENVNSFAIETMRTRGDRFTPLGSVHPETPDPERQFRRLRDAGIPGLKLHPDYMGFFIDDPAFDEIFALAASCGMFVLIHAGFDVFSPDLIHATPERILARMKRSPDTVLVAAHYGGNCLYDEVEEKLLGRDLYIDASLGELMHLAPEQAARILTNHDADRILFGSDCPWASPADTFRFLDALPLSDDRKEKLYRKNAARLLGLAP